MILAPKKMSKAKEEKEAAEICMEVIELEQEKFRLGHTKVETTHWWIWSLRTLKTPAGSQQRHSGMEN